MPCPATSLNVLFAPRICRGSRHPLRRAAALAILLVLTAWGPARGAGFDLTFTSTDSVGDSGGGPDLVRMDVYFSSARGDFQIDVTAEESRPFAGRFYANIEIQNVEQTSELHASPDFELAVPKTTVSLFGSGPSNSLGEGDQQDHAPGAWSLPRPLRPAYGRFPQASVLERNACAGLSTRVARPG